MASVVFKEAESDLEIEQVHRLNHRTFAEELGQHPATAEGLLVDRYHGRNHYFIAVENGRLVGMISINDQAPFSIQKRLPADLDLGALFPSPCEVRLLAIERGARHRTILAGLFWRVYDYARKHAHSHMLISGVEERLAMYKALGFQALGPAVAEGASSFVPMALDLRKQPAGLSRRTPLYSSWFDRHTRLVSLLPGPVAIGPAVRQAFERPVLSHREEAFLEIYGRVREQLSRLAAGMETGIVTGSGTLANDIVGATLRSAMGDAPGLVLANGEFGERLVGQARRAGLKFKVLDWAWGTAWDFARIEDELRGPVGWVWGVHLETSTGQLNDLRRLGELCEQRGAGLAADCVSSLGAVSLEGTRLLLASGVSGKAIGAYPGLAFVFARRGAVDRIRFDQVPASFDLRSAMNAGGPMFTTPSAQLLALDAALASHYADPAAAAARYEHYTLLGGWMRDQLRQCGLEPLTGGADAAPTIASFPLPDERCADRCRSAGFQIAHQSNYLRERGWGQISIMGELDTRTIAPVFAALRG